MELNPVLPQFKPGNPHGNPQNLTSGPRGTTDRGVDLNRFFGRTDPKGTHVRRYEQPWHRNAAYMVASGTYSMKAVAAACDKSYAGVLQLLKNPWFQETVAEIQKENGAKDIMDVFRAECMSSLATIVELRDNEKTPPAVRRQSAIDILHQCLGKPTQRVEMEQNVTSDDPVAEVARLENENERLRHTTALPLSDGVQGESSL